MYNFEPSAGNLIFVEVPQRLDVVLARGEDIVHVMQNSLAALWGALARSEAGYAISVLF